MEILKDRPRGHSYTPEQVKFMRENCVGITTGELLQMFNAKFGTNLIYGQLCSAKKHHKLSSGVVTRFAKGAGSYPRGVGYQHKYTQEQIEWLRENATLPNYLLTEYFNERFCLDRTENQIIKIKYKHKMKGAPRGGASMRFKTGYPKGHKSAACVPVGTERCVHPDGYVEIKIKDGCGMANWEFKHRKIWEEANGPIPKGYIVTFADGNRKNLELSNLLLISRKQNAVLNNIIKRSADPDITKASLPLADLILKIGKKAR